jgi:hypothetical protein
LFTRPLLFRFSFNFLIRKYYNLNNFVYNSFGNFN